MLVVSSTIPHVRHKKLHLLFRADDTNATLQLRWFCSHCSELLLAKVNLDFISTKILRGVRSSNINKCCLLSRYTVRLIVCEASCHHVIIERTNERTNGLITSGLTSMLRRQIFASAKKYHIIPTYFPPFSWNHFTICQFSVLTDVARCVEKVLRTLDVIWTKTFEKVNIKSIML